MRALAEWPRTLDGENANIVEIEELKEHAASKVAALRYEVNMLKQEVASLKVLMKIEDESSGEPRKPKPEKVEKTN